MTKHALLIGASGGIGAGLKSALTQRGYTVDTLSRRDDQFDITNEQSIVDAASARRDKAYALIFVASGILDVQTDEGLQGPEKAFRELGPEAGMKAFAVNALGPALVFKHFAPLLVRGERAVFTALSARVGSIGDNGLCGWMSYRASKAALNQFMRCAAIEHQRNNKEHIVVALHPGTVPTPLTEKYAKGRYTADPGESAGQMLDVLENLGKDDNGGFFDYAGKTIPW